MPTVHSYTTSSPPPTNLGSGLISLGTQAPIIAPNQPQGISGSNLPRDRAAINADIWKARFYKWGTWGIGVLGAALAVGAVAIALWFNNYSNMVSANNAKTETDINNINENINLLRSQEIRDVDRLQ
ncbi:MAG TPA: hypothetical protein VEP90_01070, partial [Methylomirabilota bacterium]|nr:hypothetical protein [Methylomirabilota bacterium]